MSDVPSTPLSATARTSFAQQILAQYQADVAKSEPNPGQLPELSHPARTSSVKVGILGAGAAGLYAAMIINSFKDKRIKCEILESNLGEQAPTPRKGGGRLYTHHFENGGENDYFDIGAMRFPDIPIMESVRWLLHDSKSPIHGKLKMIPYVLKSPNNIKHFNGITKTQGEIDTEGGILNQFKTGINAPGTVEALTKQAFGILKSGLVDNFDQGWIDLMALEKWSTRQYMRQPTRGGACKCTDCKCEWRCQCEGCQGAVFKGPGFTDEVIDWLETFNSGTNLYDSSVAEGVMASLEFEYHDHVKWWCVQGGAGRIADAMADTLHPGQIKRGQKVTKISIKGEDLAKTVYVHVNNKEESETYDHVITTLPFGCLRVVDTTECYLSWHLQTAIRTLRYDSSVKIAMRFTDRWWETCGEPGYNNVPHVGGVSSTDRLARTIVYPSYGIGSKDSATMIVSYTWAQDALRIGAFMQGKESRAEKDLISTILQDLQTIHGIDSSKHPNYLRNRLMDYKMHDWYADSDACGAFARFGPGQFSNLFKTVTVPAAGCLHFAGEATSVHHAWVEGALISAYRAVLEILIFEGFKDLEMQLRTKWPTPDWIRDDPDILKVQVAIGQTWRGPETE